MLREPKTMRALGRADRKVSAAADTRLKRVPCPSQGSAAALYFSRGLRQGVKMASGEVVTKVPRPLRRIVDNAMLAILVLSSLYIVCHLMLWALAKPLMVP